MPVFSHEVATENSRSFNCGWSCPKPIKPQRGGRRMAKDSVVPPGLGFVWRRNPQLKLRAIVSRASGAGASRCCRPRERQEKVCADQPQVEWLAGSIIV